jgi:hypothetical protein
MGVVSDSDDATKNLQKKLEWGLLGAGSLITRQMR